MKLINKIVPAVAGLLLACVGFNACQKADSAKQYGVSMLYMPQAVAQSGSAGINYPVPAGTDSSSFNYVLDAANGKIQVRLGAALSGYSSIGYSVDVQVANDTITKLYASGTLDPATYIIMPESMYALPSKLTVEQGKMSGGFYLTIDAAQLKSGAYTGKTLILGVKITNPTNYNVNTAENTTLIMLNVNDMLNAFQRIYMPQASAKYIVPTGGDPSTYNYSVDAVNNKVNVKLSAATGTVVNGTLKNKANANAYTVDIQVNNDTIQKMLAAGTLNPATDILMPASLYTVPSQLSVPAGQINGAGFSLSLDIAQLKSASYRDKNLVLAVKIANPSAYDLNPSLSTTIISVNINELVMGPANDVSALYITNNVSPFKNSGLKPGQTRWGNLTGWNANAAVMSHAGFGGYGSDGDGQLIDLEAGWGEPAIPNGKLYQTVTLPAGTYSVDVTWIWASILWAPDPGNGSAYVVVAPGADLPDYNNIEGNSSLYYYKFANSIAKGTVQKVVFTLTQPTQVSLGFVVNYPGTASGQGFKVSSFKLNNYPKSL